MVNKSNTERIHEKLIELINSFYKNDALINNLKIRTARSITQKSKEIVAAEGLESYIRACYSEPNGEEDLLIKEFIDLLLEVESETVNSALEKVGAERTSVTSSIFEVGFTALKKLWLLIASTLIDDARLKDHVFEGVVIDIFEGLNRNPICTAVNQSFAYCYNEEPIGNGDYLIRRFNEESTSFESTLKATIRIIDNEWLTMSFPDLKDSHPVYITRDQIAKPKDVYELLTQGKVTASSKFLHKDIYLIVYSITQ